MFYVATFLIIVRCHATTKALADQFLLTHVVLQFLGHAHKGAVLAHIDHFAP